MTPQNKEGIATGNWGCGIFNGDKILKFIIQLLAASAANRTGMLYHTYNDPTLQKTLFNIHQVFVKRKETIRMYNENTNLKH
jgi:poly(ADP-ribose) glycohydrolase